MVQHNRLIWGKIIRVINGESLRLNNHPVVFTPSQGINNKIHVGLEGSWVQIILDKYKPNIINYLTEIKDKRLIEQIEQYHYDLNGNKLKSKPELNLCRYEETKRTTAQTENKININETQSKIKLNPIQLGMLMNQTIHLITPNDNLEEFKKDIKITFKILAETFKELEKEYQ